MKMTHRTRSKSPFGLSPLGLFVGALIAAIASVVSDARPAVFLGCAAMAIAGGIWYCAIKVAGRRPKGLSK